MTPSLSSSLASAGLLLALASGASAQTSTWIGAASSSWSDGANWSPPGVPDASTDVVVPAVATSPASYLADPVCRDLTVEAGGSLSLGSGFDLFVAGDLELQGGLSIVSPGSILAVDGDWFDAGGFSAATGSVALTGSGSLEGAGTGFPKLFLTGGTRTCLTPFAAQEVVLGGGASLDLGGLTHTVAGNWTSNAAGATVLPGGTLEFSATGRVFTAANSLPNLVVSGGTRSFNPTVVAGDLTMTGGTLRLLDGATLSVGGDLALVNGQLTFVDTSAALEVIDVEGSALVTATAGATSSDARIRVAGNWSSDAAFAPAAGQVELDGPGPVSIGGSSPTLANLRVGSADCTLVAPLTLTGDLSLAPGAHLRVEAPFDTHGVIADVGSTLELALAGGSLSGDWTDLGGAATGPQALTFNGDGALATASGSLGHVTIADGVRTCTGAHLTGDLTLASGELRIADNASLQVDGDASFAAGALLAFDDATPGNEVLDVAGALTGASAVTPTSVNTRILCGGDWIAHAPFAPSGGFVSLMGTADVAGSAPVFPSLVIGPGVRTTTTDTTVTADLTLLAGATLVSQAPCAVVNLVSLGDSSSWDLGGHTHLLAGSYLSSGGDATGGGRLEFLGTGTLSSGGGLVAHVLVSGGTLTVVDSLVTGTLEIDGGQLDLAPDQSLFLGGDLTLTSGGLTLGSGASLATAGAAQLTGGSLLTFPTLADGSDDLLAVAGDLSLDATLAGTSADTLIRCGGNWTSGPGFAPAAGRVQLEGAAPVQLSGQGQALAFADLILAGAAVAQVDALDLSGDLELEDGASLQSLAPVSVGGSVTLAGPTCAWDLGGLDHEVQRDWTSLGGDGLDGSVTFGGGGNLSTGAGSLHAARFAAGVRVVKSSTVVTDVTLSGGAMRLSDNASLSVGGDLDLTAGVLAFDGLTPGPSVIDVQGAAHLACASGTINGEVELRVAGDWSGTSAWNPSSGRVVLDGAGSQTIGGPSPRFHTLELAGASTTVDVATTLAGDLILNAGGALTTSAPLDVGGSVLLGDASASWSLGGQAHTVAHDWRTLGASATGPGRVDFTGDGELATGAGAIAEVHVSGGTRTLRQTDVTGDFTLDGGTLVVGDDVVLTIGGDAQLLSGTLTFADTLAGDDERIAVGGSATVTASAGTHTKRSVISVAGDWASSGAYAPAAGRVELQGPGTRLLSGLGPDSDPTFATLRVLSGARVAGNDLTLRAAGVTVEAGAELGAEDHSLTVPAGLVAVDGLLSVGAGGSLALGAGAAVSVSPTGTLRVVGQSDAPAVVTGHDGGGWLANVAGALQASHFRFEQMGPAGLLLPASASLAAAPLDLRGGVFAQPSPTPGSVMLDIQRGEPTELRYVSFEDPQGVGSFNVRSFSGAPIMFVNSGGDFGGAEHEQDPFRLIEWSQESTVILSFTGAAGLNKVSLDWASVLEVDVDQWLLERAPSAGGPYELLAEVDADGSGGDYQLLDLEATGGQTWYYRLSERLTHGQVQEVAALQATPWPAGLPRHMATVGTFGDFSDIQTAVDSLRGQAGPTVLVQPGSYPAFSIGPGLVGTLRVVGVGPGVQIDTSAGAVQVAGLGALESVELSDLQIGDPSSIHPALEVSGCAGVVIVDESTLQAGPGVAALEVSASTRVAVQRSQLSGDPGLALAAGSLALAGGGDIDSIDLAGGSDLRTAQVGAPVVSVDGSSTHLDLPGVHADLDLPELVPLGSPFAVTLTGEPNGTCAVVWSLALGWTDFQGNLWELVGMADLTLGDILLTLPLGPGGQLTFPVSLPADGALLGYPIVLQTVVINPADNHRRWSNVAAIIGTP